MRKTSINISQIQPSLNCVDGSALFQLSVFLFCFLKIFLLLSEILSKQKSRNSFPPPCFVGPAKFSPLWFLKK